MANETKTYVKVTSGQGWHADMEGAVFETHGFDLSIDAYYAEDDTVSTRKVISKVNCAEVELSENDMVIEVTNGRWWYKDLEGLRLVAYKRDDNYQDGSLDFEPTRAYAVYGPEDRTRYVLVEDCVGIAQPASYFDLDEVDVERIAWEAEQAIAELEAQRKDDAVEHPSHYTAGKFEVIEIIEEITKHYDNAYVGYCVGNALKYLSRAPHKHDTPDEDIRKAAKYLEFALQHIEASE